MPPAASQSALLKRLKKVLLWTERILEWKSAEQEKPAERRSAFPLERTELIQRPGSFSLDQYQHCAPIAAVVFCMKAVFSVKYRINIFYFLI